MLLVDSYHFSPLHSFGDLQTRLECNLVEQSCMIIIIIIVFTLPLPIRHDVLLSLNRCYKTFTLVVTTIYCKPNNDRLVAICIYIYKPMYSLL